jgi:hypothetical protein
MKRNEWILLTVFLFLAAQFVDSAAGDTFGSGANSFQIDFVTIGSAGNAPDTTGNPNPAGAVPYEYRMGKYEISEQMIDKANALGGLGITKDTRGPDKPATSISWFDAARFVNWLNMSTGHQAAYKFDSGNNFQVWAPADTGYDPANLYRNSLAYYFLPSVDEWYKAAFYDPRAGVYYDYATESDNVPDGIDFAGDPNFDAVFFDGGFNSMPNDVADVGLPSPFGTEGQGGNAWEWQETNFDFVNDPNLTGRGFRGGFWASVPEDISSLRRESSNPGRVWFDVGFRVGSTVPEPSSAMMISIAGTMLLVGSRGYFGSAASPAGGNCCSGERKQ